MGQSSRMHGKNSFMNTFKHNLEKQYLDHLPGSLGWEDYYWYSLTLHSLFYLFIDLSVYLFTYLFFSLAFLAFYCNFYFTFLPSPLSSLTMCFILFIIWPFYYFIMFLIRSSFLCYSVIIYLVFMHFTRIN